MAFFVEGQVWADRLPRLPGVGRHHDVLSADVDPIVVVGRNQDWYVPVEAILHVGWFYAEESIWPRRDRAGFPSFQIQPAYVSVIGTNPEDVFIARIRYHKSTLTTRNIKPVALRNTSPCTRQVIAWRTERSAILLVAVNIVGNPIIGS